jgi:uncharacterized alpha-E superfamily protein
MLSRIAESLFWIGRYIERADGTARILDVYLQLLLEDTFVDEDTACRALLAVMGNDAPPERTLRRGDVIASLAIDRMETTSIAYSVKAARENARRAREIISTELWEVLNTTHTGMPRRVSGEKVHELFGWVRERAALATGIADSTASRDDAWSFMTLGRSLERADMTARLLATRVLTEDAGPSWTTILRSVGAYEAYLRTYRGVPSSTNAAEFLMLDRLFPRSILFSVLRAEQCLRDIEPRHERVGYGDSAQRMLGQVRAELEFRPIGEIIDDLPSVMDQVQTTTTKVSEAVRERYFPTHNLPAWVGERA